MTTNNAKIMGIVYKSLQVNNPLKKSKKRKSEHTTGVNIARDNSSLITELNDGDDTDFVETLEAILLDEEDILNEVMLPEEAPSYIEEMFNHKILEGIDCHETCKSIN
jgi:hypothetical protein